MGTDSAMSELQTCRIVVVGAHKLGITKAMAVIAEPDLQEDIKSISEQVPVSVQYLPCVAVFDSYSDESGKRIRYLASVNYHADLLREQDKNTKHPSSLLEIFDGENSVSSSTSADKREVLSFPGISGIAVGGGIDSEEDVDQISSYFKTMLSASTSNSEPIALPVECVQPSNGYGSMRDELNAFKAMDAEQKSEATRTRALGPGKMAKFVVDFTRKIIQDKLEQRRIRREAAMEAILKNQVAIQNEGVGEIGPELPHEIDPSKDRFACRSCRRVLFGEDDFQDPPHVPSQHNFGYHKHGGKSGNLCQSFFLQSGLDWMGDTSEMEGKFSCPKCKSKLGSWHWSGSQCSCGTWVVPAIQIPKGRVDLVPPQSNELPPGTIISCLVGPQQQQQVAGI